GAVRRAVRGGRRQPRGRRAVGDGDHRGQVLRVGRPPRERRAIATDGPGRRDRAARIGRVLPGDGEQLQHVAAAGGRGAARRGGNADPASGDVRGSVVDGRVWGVVVGLRDV